MWIGCHKTCAVSGRLSVLLPKPTSQSSLFVSHLVALMFVQRSALIMSLTSIQVPSANHLETGLWRPWNK